MHINCKRHLFDTFVVGIFSMIMALGAWNPFMSQNIENTDDIDNWLSQIGTILFIVYLAIKQIHSKHNVSAAQWVNNLFIFAVIFIISSLIGMPSNSNWQITLFAKLFADIFLTILLFKFFSKEPKLINYSLIIFALSCTVISTLFISGILDRFIIMRNGRMIFSGENPNSTSTRIALGAVLLSFYIFINPLKWGKKRYIWALFLLPMFLMVLASGSRGSTILMVLGITIMLFFGKYSIQSKVIAILSVVLLGIIFFYKIYSNYGDELAIYERFISMADGNDAGRTELNRYAWKIFLERPFIGYGDAGFMHEMNVRFGETRTVHNLYFYILATTGILGAIPFFYFLTYILTKSLKISRKNILPIVIIVFVLLLVGKTGGVLTYSLIWWLFAVALAEIQYTQSIAPFHNKNS